MPHLEDLTARLFGKDSEAHIAVLELDDPEARAEVEAALLRVG